MNKKSAAAQELYKSQESKYKSLLEEKNSLQEEVDSGSASDRKIFELASKQSNREASIAAEIESRDLAVQRMIQTLVGRDGEMADMEVKYDSVKRQLDEYSRMQRRNDVNVDYLKGVLVKYLSLPSGSSERKSLLSVIATLLQFGPEDYQTIETGYHQTSWFWGAVAPKEIGAKRSTPTKPPAAKPNSAPAAPPPPQKPSASGDPGTPSGGSLMQSASESPDLKKNIGEVKVAAPAAPPSQQTRRQRTSMQF